MIGISYAIKTSSVVALGVYAVHAEFVVLRGTMHPRRGDSKLKKEFQYLGFWVEVTASQPTSSEDLWVADVRYRWGQPDGDRALWASFDRSPVSASVEPDTAINQAVVDILRHLDPLVKKIQRGELG